MTPFPMPFDRLFALALLVGAGLLLVPDAQAQDQDDPPATALPDIAPREVEIRGQLEIAFPSLQRQPLIGFNPPPRVPPIPAGRQPFMAAYKQESADLPPSPLERPEPPTVSPLAGRAPENGQLDLAAGRYFHRLARLRTALPLSETEHLYVGLDYHGADGDAPFETRPEAERQFDAYEGVVGVKTYRDGLTAGGELSGFFENYALYGVTSRPAGAIASPEREGRQLGGALWVRLAPESPVTGSARLDYGRTTYSSALFDPDLRADPRTERDEGRLTLAADLVAPTSTGDVLLNATASTSGLNASFGDDLSAFDGGLGWRFSATDELRVAVGVQLLTYAASDVATGQGKRNAGYVSPHARVDYYPAGTVQLYAQHTPGLETASLADLYQTAPYLIDEPRMQPSVRTIDAEGGLRLFFGPVQLAARAGYEAYPSRRFFERAPATSALGFTDGFVRTRFAEARILHVGADASVVLASGLHATLGVTARDGELTDQEVAIPYFAPLTAQAMLSYSFAESRGLAQLTGTFASERYVDQAETDQVGAFLDLDAHASFRITPTLGVVARVENLTAGDRARWAGYPIDPFVVMGGVQVVW